MIFLLVRFANKVLRSSAEAAADPAEVELLREIRDELKKRNAV
jgi:large conductance mechanosensitive channel